MTKLITLFKTFSADESGAALIEYTMLVALIAAATVALILAAGWWVFSEWTSLSSALGFPGTAPTGF